MPTDRSARRILAFALGAASLFDITGAILYRALRDQLPEPGQAAQEGPFQTATKIIQQAHSEALMRASRPAARVTRHD
jgi:hypothetical protein